MLIHIDRLIDETQLRIMRGALESAEFHDGRRTAGSAAAQVKNNLELDLKTNVAKELAQVMVGNLYNNAQFRDAALPHRVAQPLFARYTTGQEYGPHIDDPVMGEHNQRFRCDIALTLFINEPSEYDGGELAISTPLGEHKVKLPAGAAVLYSADSLHRVCTVTRGVRLVGVTWIQSLIRDAGQRAILWDLAQARQRLRLDPAQSENAQQIDHAYVNLVRRWAEV